jgi:lysozyme family protein
MKYLTSICFCALLFLFVGTKLYAADCATIEKVETSINQINYTDKFKCIVTVDARHAGSGTIACGVSFNGEYPSNKCPSDGTNFLGWHSNQATFQCSLDDVSPDIIKSSNFKIVAFDFQNGCGFSTGITKPLQISTNTPTPGPTNSSTTNNPYEINLNGPTLPTDPSKNYTIDLSGSSPTPGASSSRFFWQNSFTYTSDLIGFAQKCLRNKSVYEQASQATGVPWPILAGIHYREGGCNSNQSLVSGRRIGNVEPDVTTGCSANNTLGKPKPVGGGCGFSSLLDSAIYSGNHLKQKISKVPSTMPELTIALSRYNGTGNQNCGKTPYKGCPPMFPGEDDTYVMNFYDMRHAEMYQVYCSDGTRCASPKRDINPGVLTITNIVSSL